jgi:hypothetical protein
VVCRRISGLSSCTIRDGNRQRAINAGYQKHISKPAEPEELAMAIAAVTGRLSSG